MNSVCIMGRITRDPELRYTNDQTAVCRYSIAVDRPGTDKVDFINVVAFGRGADFAVKYFTKGLRVGITGHIQTGDYTDRNGVKRRTFDVIAERQDFADVRRNGPETAQEAAQDPDFVPVPDTDDDDLPF